MACRAIGDAGNERTHALHATGSQKRRAMILAAATTLPRRKRTKKNEGDAHTHRGWHAIPATEQKGKERRGICPRSGAQHKVCTKYQGGTQPREHSHNQTTARGGWRETDERKFGKRTICHHHRRRRSVVVVGCRHHRWNLGLGVSPSLFLAASAKRAPAQAVFSPGASAAAAIDVTGPSFSLQHTHTHVEQRKAETPKHQQRVHVLGHLQTPGIVFFWAFLGLFSVFLPPRARCVDPFGFWCAASRAGTTTTATMAMMAKPIATDRGDDYSGVGFYPGPWECFPLVVRARARCLCAAACACVCVCVSLPMLGVVIIAWFCAEG